MLAMLKSQNYNEQHIEKNQHKHELAIAMRQAMRVEENKNDLVWIWPVFAPNGQPQKRKKITMNQQETVTGLDCMLDDICMLDLFKQDGKAKTKRVNERHEKLNNIANLVTSALLSGKITNNEMLEKAKAEKIAMMKEHLVLANIADHCVQNDESEILNKHIHIIDSMVHEATDKKNVAPTPSQQLLRVCWETCLKDMDLVDQWANDVWQQAVQKHKIAVL